jgi:hypothetical protein
MKTAEDEAPALPAIRFRDPQIEMAHGAGGRASRRLVEGLFAPLFFGAPHGQVREPLTDAFVVRPLRFAGGSIGELAVHGTVNDLAVSAAKPLALLVTLVLEEGLPGATLEAEARAIALAARRAGVQVVGGDTKVVERGKADGMYVTTAGIGRVDPRARLSARAVRPGTAPSSPGRSATTASPSSSPAATSSSRRSSAPTPARSGRWSSASSPRPRPACAGGATRRAAASRRH